MKYLMLSKKKQNGFVLIMIKPQLTPKVKEKCKSSDRQANAVVVVSVEEAEVLSMCVADSNLRNNIFFSKSEQRRRNLYENNLFRVT